MEMVLRQVLWDLVLMSWCFHVVVVLKERGCLLLPTMMYLSRIKCYNFYMILPAIRWFRLTAVKCFHLDRISHIHLSINRVFRTSSIHFASEFLVRLLDSYLLQKFVTILSPFLLAHKRSTQSIGMLSYTFLRSTSKEDIIVPMVTPLLLFLSFQHDYYYF